MRGNISRRGKNSWRLKFDVDATTGERCTKYLTVRGSKRDAEAAPTKLLSDADNGTLVEPTKITVADHMAAWLKDKELTASTRESYQMIVRAFIVPALGA